MLLAISPCQCAVSKGINTLVFHIAQSEFTAKFSKPATEVDLADHRTVLPTIVRDVSKGKLWAATTIINSGEQPLADALVIAKLDGGDSVSTPLPWLDAASLKSCAFQFAVPRELEQEVAELSIQLVDGDTILAETRYELEVVGPAALQVHTFVSSIDRSVQSYVVRPAANAAATGNTQMVASHTSAGDSPGAVVALHTDGMSPREFASCYAPKDWAHVIVPGGRGVHPLDWEDWSSRDAIEALADARKRLEIDPARIYVTGHGMGGHGALVLAMNSPDQFAAVATSAGWPSLWTYGGGMPSYRNPSPVQSMLLRAASPSDTLSRLTNLYDAGVYLLHGADDELVPVDQSREIVQQLADWHNDFAYYVKPGAGNWWGPETVDAPQMMQFFANRQPTSEVPQRVKLTTSDLGALASSHWVTIAAQEKQFATSQIDLERKENPLTITGTTTNVKRLIIDKSAVPPGQPFVVRIDGSRPEVLRGMPASGQVWLEKRDGRWQRRLSPNKSNKGPQRYGGMKAVFDHDVLLVYGTIGNEEENDWSRAKAHFDAATFAYRANGSIDVVPDTQFDASQTKDRNVVVYGNVDTNRVWASLLSTTPVQVFRNRMTIDTRPQTGDDLGFLMVRPRVGSDTRFVAAVGGTGPRGMRLTNRLRYFWAGVGYPDFLLFGADALTAGDGGILAAGYFANDWGLEDADIACARLGVVNGAAHRQCYLNPAPNCSRSQLGRFVVIDHAPRSI